MIKMKKVFVLYLLLALGICIRPAEAKKVEKKLLTTVFVTDIECDHCVRKIMNNVPALGKGVEDVRVDLPKKEVTVVYDGAKNNVGNLIKGFASLKIKATPKPASVKR